jgi:quercetin dioxygenase-like cupin family protein
MDQVDFLKTLESKGFPGPIRIVREPGGLGEHSHPFESQALITQGSITLVIDGVETSYLPGDVFHLLSGQVHSESYGPEGVEYLVSRKEK